MSDRMIALEVGTDGIRMAELHRSAGAVIFPVKSSYAEYLSGLPTELPREAVVAMTLKQLLEEQSLKTKRVHLAVDGSSVFSRLVKLPMVGKEQLQKTIRHEAVQHIPFPIDEVVWDACIINPDADEPDVLLVAVKADVIDGLAYAVKATGLMIERISVAPIALANAVRSIGEAEESTLVVEVGRTVSNLVFLDGDRIFFRTLSVGENQLDRLAQEVDRSITFYHGQQQGSPPCRMVVCGTVETVEFLKRRQSIPVVPSSLGPDVVVCVGLAAEQAFSIDLVPESLRHERDVKMRYPVRVACMVVLMLLLAVWIYSFRVQTSRIRASTMGVENQIEALHAIEQRMFPLENQIERLLRESDTYASIVEQRMFWLETLSEIDRLLPEGMFVPASEPIRSEGRLVGVRISVVSYLDKEPEGRDAVKLVRDTLRGSSRFDEKTHVFSRPSKKMFAREFELDVYFAEGAAW